MLINREIIRDQRLNFKIFGDEVYSLKENGIKTNFHYVAGHFWHDHIGCLQGWQIVTLIRHPVARFFSEWRYASENPNHYLYAEARKGIDVYMRWYLENSLSALYNQQCRLISGSASAEGAISRLSCDFSQFASFELIEDFLYSVRKSACLLTGTDAPSKSRSEVVNRTYPHAPTSAREEDVIKCLEANNVEDVKLYQFVCDNPVIIHR